MISQNKFVLSQSFPTEAELQLSDSLEAFLRSMNLYPTSDRQMIIYKLGNLLKEVGGLLYTFGSFRLGVYSDTSDIDSLLICNSRLSREQIKNRIVELVSSCPEASNIAAVDQAYVPVVNFTFNNIPIDLVYCRLNMLDLEEPLNTEDNHILVGLDEQSIRSLNGHRVTDMILKLVPSVEQFRIALRAIKLWAKRKGIYGNVMGFFGGVAWAMCVAKICQLYPNATASVLVCKFFKVFYQWRWPSPVTLRDIEDYSTATNFESKSTHPNLNMRVWNPTIYPSDRAHRMPVITPAYPSMCATHNVTLSTQLIMTEEFKSSAETAEKILNDPQAVLALDQGINSKEEKLPTTWEHLFSPNNFFSRYKYYLTVIAVATNPEDHLIWSGMVESRIRQLVAKLELVDCLHLAHPHTKTFERIVRCESERDSRDVDSGRFDLYFEKLRKEEEDKKESDAKLDLASVKTGGSSDLREFMDIDESNTPPPDNQPQSEKHTSSTVTKDSTEIMYTTSFYIGLSLNQDRKTKKLDISWPISDFTQMCNGWDKFSESTMCLSVHHVKASQLHPDVFDKPLSVTLAEKKSKESKRSQKEPPAKKRKGSGEDVKESKVSPANSKDESKASPPSPNTEPKQHVPSARTQNIRQTILKYVNEANKPSRT
eukprot:NODE_407_length_7978_cov_0.670009.p1 type:complete len:654 gc:universal NODE_407_length_7978_cov_0.670009:3584-5545(+)